MKEEIKYAEIHIVKFIFTCFMIFNHICIWSIEYYYRQDILRPSTFLYDFVFGLPLVQYTAIFSLSIPITAGIILRERLDRYIVTSKIWYYPISQIFKDASLLFLIESIVRSVAFGWASFFDWSELKFMALSFIIIVLLAKKDLRLIPITGPLVLLLSPFAHAYLGERPSNYLVKILVGNNGNHFYWPFFPWYFSVAFGFSFHHYYLRWERKVFIKRTAWLAAFLLTIWGLLPPLNIFDVSNITGGRLYWPGLPFFFIYVSLFLVIFLGAICVSRFFPLNAHGPTYSMSKGILLVYIFLYVFGFRICEFVNRSFEDPFVFSLYVIFPLFFLISWMICHQGLKFFEGVSYQIIFRKV